MMHSGNAAVEQLCVEKFSERALACKNTLIRHLIVRLSADDYVVKRQKHQFDEQCAIMTIVVVIHNTDIVYIEECLRSITSQTYSNVEIVLVDHGTTGIASEIIDCYVEANKNITLVRAAENIYDVHSDQPCWRIFDLWNAALLASHGDYVYILACDDFIDDCYAEKIVQLFEENPTCISASVNVRLVDANSKVWHDTQYCNRRPRYIDGCKLVKGYFENRGMLSICGGMMAQRSEVVIEQGGFDAYNDITQVLRFAHLGEVGTDLSSSIYWRVHTTQSNKFQNALGCLYYNDMMQKYEELDIYRRHREISGLSYAEYCKKRYRQCATNTVSATLVSSPQLIPFNRIGRVLRECPLDVFFVSCQSLAWHRVVSRRTSWAISGMKKILRKLGRHSILKKVCLLMLEEEVYGYEEDRENSIEVKSGHNANMRDGTSSRDNQGSWTELVSIVDMLRKDQKQGNAMHKPVANDDGTIWQVVTKSIIESGRYDSVSLITTVPKYRGMEGGEGCLADKQLVIESYGYQTICSEVIQMESDYSTLHSGRTGYKRVLELFEEDGIRELKKAARVSDILIIDMAKIDQGLNRIANIISGVKRKTGGTATVWLDVKGREKNRVFWDSLWGDKAYASLPGFREGIGVALL